MRHWFPSVPVWIWSLVFMILIFLSNFFSVKIFAESEFWFAAVKVAAIVAFIILGGLAVVFVWMAIALCQLKFRQKWLKEGHTEDELKFKTPLYPFTPWFAFIASLASCLLIWFDPSQRVALYATIPFVIFCYVAHHFYAKHQEKKQTSL